jgi:DNA-binding XRE family transcriptional regulator
MKGGDRVRRIREYTEFGLWARGILMELNMTQAELADAVGAGKSTITDAFTGKTRKNQQLCECIEGYLKRKISSSSRQNKLAGGCKIHVSKKRKSRLPQGESADSKISKNSIPLSEKKSKGCFDWNS